MIGIIIGILVAVCIALVVDAGQMNDEERAKNGLGKRGQGR